MKLASRLWLSRHGVYYIRQVYQGKELRRSLKTKDPLIARKIAYRLGAMNQDDVIKKLKSGAFKGYKH